MKVAYVFATPNASFILEKWSESTSSRADSGFMATARDSAGEWVAPQG